MLDRQKQLLRTKMKARRDRVSPRDREQAAQLVAKHMEPVLKEKTPQNIGLYFPVQSEFDTLPLAQKLWEQGASLSLPVVMGKELPLVFRPWTSDDELEARAFNIKIPQDNGLSVFPDMLVIPLLAFDKNGARLGYGGGYYDRTLEILRAKKDLTVLGLAYDFQEADVLPVASHDECLDFILTPSGLCAF